MQGFLNQYPVGTAEKFDDMNIIIYTWKKKFTDFEDKEKGKKHNKEMCF